MDYFSPSIPQISISPAPPEEPCIEPASPFASFAFCVQGDDDGFRPVHLTPPPTSCTFKRPRSPLNPVDEPMPGKGLDGDRFQVLLNAAKSTGAKRGTDLRKTIALKVHKNKQAERRALFLSKVQAPPSPSATITPKTPPESPAIFHYSLPSPGLMSPLALFETLKEDSYSIRVEQVDFRLPGEMGKQYKHDEPKPPMGLPSLDQISARLIPRSAKADADLAVNTTATKPPRPSIGVGRLRMPLRTSNQHASHPSENVKPTLPPKSPLLHLSPELRVTTLVVPRSRTTSAAQLTESNLNAFNSRDQKAHAMLSTIRRRTLSSDFKAPPPAEDPDAQHKWRRRSAPADIMPFRPRTGFEHPVLALPGGF
ncbi:hypothetical protein CPB84DRAFT_1670672 [Gymnopilus junonius]|uniref:Uncharacterized protein n=1 Tax=Gymnopilus junonius TaxID=109634 RepID=A0A9P5TUF4_GYMJU|nr:hypothetical protein CPB84DRAFT_1670672 [Gymnopilus junonius]